MAKKTEFSYEDGDFVVYPTHGVGRIIGKETQSRWYGYDIACHPF